MSDGHRVDDIEHLLRVCQILWTVVVPTVYQQHRFTPLVFAEAFFPLRVLVMHSVRPRASDLCIAGVPDTLRWAVKTGYYNKIELLCSFDRLCYESLSGAQMMLGIAGFDAKDINRMRKNMQTEIGVYPYTSFLNAMFLGDLPRLKWITDTFDIHTVDVAVHRTAVKECIWQCQLFERRDVIDWVMEQFTLPKHYDTPFSHTERGTKFFYNTLLALTRGTDNNKRGIQVVGQIEPT